MMAEEQPIIPTGIPYLVRVVSELKNDGYRLVAIHAGMATA